MCHWGTAPQAMSLLPASKVRASVGIHLVTSLSILSLVDATCIWLARCRATFDTAGRTPLQHQSMQQLGRQQLMLESQQDAEHAASHSVFTSPAGHEVAVKVFKGEASPDGRAADEIDVTCAVAHPNLIRVIGLVQQPHALVVHKVSLTLTRLHIEHVHLACVTPA